MKLFLKSDEWKKWGQGKMRDWESLLFCWGTKTTVLNHVIPTFIYCIYLHLKAFSTISGEVINMYCGLKHLIGFEWSWTISFCLFQWREVARELDGIIRIGAINCQDEWGLCTSQGIQSYPSLKLYPTVSKPLVKSFI